MELIRPVGRQDSSPELMLINQIKNYDLKILIIVLCVCVCEGGGGGGGGVEGGRENGEWY